MDRVLKAVFLTLLTSTGCRSTPLMWQSLSASGALLRSRWFAGTVVYNNELFVFGGQGSQSGLNDTGILGDTWKYEILTSAWSEIQPLPESETPSPRYGFVGGLVENFWIVSHGCDDIECFSDTWALNLDTMEWSKVNTSSSHPEARFTTAGGIYPGSTELWLSMGETAAGRKLSDTWILRINIATDRSGVDNATWELVNSGGGLNQYNPLLPHARSLHAGTSLTADTFAIFGGCASGGQVGGPCPLDDAWTIRLSNRTWVEFPQCPSPRTRHAMIMFGSKTAILFGGSQIQGPGLFPQPVSSEEYNSTEIYLMTANANRTLNEMDWKRVFVSAPTPDRLDGVSLAYDPSGNNVYLFGGRLVGSSEYQKVIWRLNGNEQEEIGVACPSPQFSYLHLHGIFMYIAWGFLLPLGALLGRYYKWAWPCWFVMHVILQSVGVLFTVAGFVVVFLVGNQQPNFAHAIIGIILTGLLIQQYLSGIFHPCVDKENGKTHKDDKSIFRKCWEVYHAVSGFISVAIGIGQITLGVLLVAAPLVVWAVWCGLGGLWLLVFLVHECSYLCYKICNRNRDIE